MSRIKTEEINVINLQIVITDDGFPKERVRSECFAQNYDTATVHEQTISDAIAKELYALVSKVYIDLGYGKKDIIPPHECIREDTTHES